jgi:nucleoside-diphosphate-sugar epimerase
VRVVVTGGNGFIGQALVSTLAGRGDRVDALVRDETPASELRRLGAQPVPVDLHDVAALKRALAGADAVIHAAGSYRVGIAPSERPAMWDANVTLTERVLDAATAVGAPRIVYVSTVNAFGNTRGQIVDERYRRDPADGFVSWYDETKYAGHLAAERRIDAGAPVVIVMPSQVYGPRDHSLFGEQLRRAFEGRLPYRTLDEVGVCLVHVDDLASGIVAALDRGRLGASYVLAGSAVRLRDALEIAARLGGRRLTRLRVPTRLLKALAPAGALIGQPNLRELISASAGVTYWASNDTARAELKFAPRPLDEGFRATFGVA